MRFAWLEWIGRIEWSHRLKTAVVWIKRATGVGYRKFPPLVDGGYVDPYVVSRLEAHAKAMIREVENLDTEIRRSGLGNPRQR